MLLSLLLGSVTFGLLRVVLLSHGLAQLLKFWAVRNRPIPVRWQVRHDSLDVGVTWLAYWIALGDPVPLHVFGYLLSVKAASELARWTLRKR